MTIRAIDRLTDRHVDDLLQLYQLEWWTQNRTIDEVRRMLSHSDLIFPFVDDRSNRLVAFARVLTDFVYKAIIFDVIVDRELRDQGIGRILLDRILDHPMLQAVEHLELYCLPDLLPFYEKWGFTASPGDLQLLRIVRTGRGSDGSAGMR